MSGWRENVIGDDANGISQRGHSAFTFTVIRSLQEGELYVRKNIDILIKMISPSRNLQNQTSRQLFFLGEYMSRRVLEYLTFRPASEKPTVDLHGRNVLALNPCNGWHQGIIHALEMTHGGCKVGIYTLAMKEMAPHDFYVAWTLLPDYLDLSERFKSEK